MSKLVVTRANQQTLLAWASARLGTGGAWAWGCDADAVGVVEKDTGRIVFVMVLNAFYDDSCEIHQVSDGTAIWANRRILEILFTYAFRVRKVTRLLAIMSGDRKRALSIAIRLGFTIEGRIRASSDGKKHQVVASMFENECPWLRQDHTEGGNDGQERTGT
jgi:hypothetical protein